MAMGELRSIGLRGVFRVALLLAWAGVGCAAHGPPEAKLAATASASATTSLTPPKLGALDAGAPSTKLFATSLACGSGHCCAGFDSGEIRCWGHNESGQLGDGSTVSRPYPALVAAT